MILIQTQISIIQTIVYFVAAVVPIFLFFVLKMHDNSNNNHFRGLLEVLAGFVIVQGIYHFVGALGFSQLAKGILEPISFVILLLFAICYFITRSKAKKKEDAKVQ